MPGICCAVGCNNSRQRNPELQFYSIPKELDRRNKWLALIRRDHWHTITPRPFIAQTLWDHARMQLAKLQSRH
uniref:THAP-type domain-containing protein n=1 Tax=Sinocyclocheilus anshuiensis TaxID=1608454 RepID=A0A671T8D2_9TELE